MRGAARIDRRGFIALATAAAVVPQELIAAPVVRKTWEARTLGPALAARTSALAESMLQTREAVTANILNRSFMSAAAFREALEPILNEVFTAEYAKQDWQEIFKDSEALAGEVGGGVREGEEVSWEETESSSENLAVECRGAGSVYDSLGVGESARPNLRQRG